MTDESTCPQDKLALVFGALLARLWLAVRALQSGIEKYAGTTTSEQPIEIDGAANEYGLASAQAVKEYALSHYHGVPDALYKQFSGEPLMLKWALPLYDKILGPALLLLGLGILLGIASRTSLFLLGLLYISLTWGLILLGEPGTSGVAWLGIHLLLIVMALMLHQHNRFTILKKW
jgi:thiosulfate dehydrogenase [quinone] large subunit